MNFLFSSDDEDKTTKMKTRWGVHLDLAQYVIEIVWIRPLLAHLKNRWLELEVAASKVSQLDSISICCLDNSLISQLFIERAFSRNSFIGNQSRPNWAKLLLPSATSSHKSVRVCLLARITKIMGQSHDQQASAWFWLSWSNFNYQLITYEHCFVSCWSSAEMVQYYFGEHHEIEIELLEGETWLWWEARLINFCGEAPAARPNQLFCRPFSSGVSKDIYH